MPIGRTTTVIERSSEVLIVDPRTDSGQWTPTKQGVAGLRYKLPVSGHRSICRSLEVLPSTRIAIDDEAGDNRIARLTDLRNWFITLVSFDGKVMHDQIPLTLFVRVAAAGRGTAFPRYFDRINLFDTRQSYVQTAVDGQETWIALRFIYADY